MGSLTDAFEEAGRWVEVALVELAAPAVAS